MQQKPSQRTADYDYELPADRIPAYPLPERSASKLLVFKEGTCFDARYTDLADYLPKGACLLFNNSRVIPARLNFVKETGGLIEIFCLEPLSMHPEEGLMARASCRWICLVGGFQKWRTQQNLRWVLPETDHFLEASFVERNENGFLIEFSWTSESLTFSEVLSALGNMPIPPYLHRPAGEDDKERYQTVYASIDGSVAAPTAGLHFTPELFQKLEDAGIECEWITLHVGAGTFKPISVDFVQDHEMHSEWVTVSSASIRHLLQSPCIITVGTTSLRSLESLVWVALETERTGQIPESDFILPQWYAYENSLTDTPRALLKALLNRMQDAGKESIQFKTQLMISPTYRIQLADMLITNFHQPQSTLLLLVDAFTNGQWKTIYNHALQNQYRFLSYGDGSLLIRPTT